MDTAVSAAPGDYDEEARPSPDGGTCGVLAQIDDERLQLMGLIVRSHRRLSFLLEQELVQAVGIPLVWFDVLIHIGGAPEGRLTMSGLSSDVALTTGGVTRLVDRMADAGLVARQNCPSDRRSVHVVLTDSGSGHAAARHRGAHGGDRSPSHRPAGRLRARRLARRAHQARSTRPLST